MSDTSPVRIGILSTANIAKKNVAAIKAAKGCALGPVASRDAARAEQFAAAYGPTRSLGSYEELLEDAETDALYVPLPTSLHDEWVPKAAAKGKHVLCEKPVAVTAGRLHAMLQACKGAGVAFMDGVMFMHHDRLSVMRKKLDEGILGTAGPRTVTSTFTFRGDQDFLSGNIRVTDPAQQLYPNFCAIGCDVMC